MHGQYLRRAAAAIYGIYGNLFEEAYYPFTNADATGIFHIMVTLP